MRMTTKAIKKTERPFKPFEAFPEQKATVTLDNPLIPNETSQKALSQFLPWQLAWDASQQQLLRAAPRRRGMRARAAARHATRPAAARRAEPLRRRPAQRAARARPCAQVPGPPRALVPVADGSEEMEVRESDSRARHRWLGLGVSRLLLGGVGRLSLRARRQPTARCFSSHFFGSLQTPPVASPCAARSCAAPSKAFSGGLLLPRELQKAHADPLCSCAYVFPTLRCLLPLRAFTCTTPCLLPCPRAATAPRQSSSSTYCAARVSR